MNLPKFPHSAMFVGCTSCSKTEFLLRLLETVYKNHFEFIVILCPTILDNKTHQLQRVEAEWKGDFRFGGKSTAASMSQFKKPFVFFRFGYFPGYFRQFFQQCRHTKKNIEGMRHN